MPSTCPYCYGTGLNKRGGPCGQCHATAHLATPLVVAKSTIDIARAMFLMAGLVFVLLALVGVIH